MRSYPTWLPLYIRALTRLVYPVECLACKTHLELQEEVLCRTCRKTLSTLTSPVCTACARPLAPYGTHRTRCPMCRRDSSPLHAVHAVVPFDATHRLLIHELKFQKKRWVLRLYRSLIAKTIKEKSMEAPDAVIAVPLDRKRACRREFNQAKDLAHLVAAPLNAPLANGILKRRSGKNPQSTLKRRERLVNLKNQFFVHTPEKIKDKSILLVDDIYTTGATLKECAHVLKSAGAKTVSAFVLARAVGHS